MNIQKDCKAQVTNPMGGVHSDRRRKLSNDNKMAAKSPNLNKRDAKLVCSEACEPVSSLWLYVNSSGRGGLDPENRFGPPLIYGNKMV